MKVGKSRALISQRCETMAKDVQTFYFDEAGFTGNDLLNTEQPVFVYAGVAMSEDLASQIHSEAISRFRIRASELKGARLLRSERGRRAISWVLSQSAEHSRIMTANKEYALAEKFFEYIFEPALASRKSFFYEIEFHKFIATLMHISAQAGDPDAIDILEGFAALMRSKDPQQLETILNVLDRLDQSSPLAKIVTFALCNRKSIEDELASVARSGQVATWSLELSMTALHWLLASWGEQFDVLDVYCDNSKPIQAGKEFFRAFIGREDKAYIRLGSQPTPSVIYNLAGPINLVDSRVSPGIQIADVLSSSLNYARNHPDAGVSKTWLKLIEDVPANQIIPETKHIDTTQQGAFVNYLVLVELVDRSIRGLNLFEDMPEFVLGSRYLYSQGIPDAALAVP